jgi:hypothetical protein
LGLIFGLSLSCKASLSADAQASSSEGTSANANGSASLDADLKASQQGEGEMVHNAAQPAGVALVAPPANSDHVLLGARHDLRLKAGQGNAVCHCLALAIGGSHSSGMDWAGQAPSIDDDTQLTLALSSEGQACQGEPKGSLGASYWGYRLKGNDVIVLVEAARGGRPLTTGAIIPKPVGPGQVYVAPASRKLPYAKQEGQAGMCKLGNPGKPRSTEFTALEVGTDAPARGGSDQTGSANDSASIEMLK